MATLRLWPRRELNPAVDGVWVNLLYAYNGKESEPSLPIMVLPTGISDKERAYVKKWLRDVEREQIRPFMDTGR